MKVQEFNVDAQKFYDAGLMRCVFASEDLCLCNVANSAYAVFSYTKTKDGQWGVLVVPENAKKIVENNDLFKVLISGLSDKELFEYSFYLNDKSFAIMQNLKKSTEKKGSTEGVDLHWEQELMSKSKSR